MKYALGSGVLWALDTVVLGIALTMTPFFGVTEALSFAAISSAFLHDTFCALWSLVYMASKGRLRDIVVGVKTRCGKAVMVGAVLAGPVGMTGYLVAINNIGAGYTAIISSFYPAFGAFLAFMFLKEQMHAGQFFALVLGLSGIMVMGYAASGDSNITNAPLGLLGAALCVIGWGSEAVIVAWGMRDADMSDVTAIVIRESTSALVYAFAVVPLFGALTFTIDAVFTWASGIVALAALAGVIAYLLFYKGIGVIGPTRAMALNISYSAWAVFFGFILLGEVPSAMTIICCVVILGGTILAASDWDELFGRKKNA